MTRRAKPLLSMTGAMAALLLSQQAAFTSDTLWDLLRSPSPTVERPAPPPQPAIAPPGVATAEGAGQPDAPKPAPARRGGFHGFFDSVNGNMRRLGRQLNSDLKIQGHKSIGLHMERVSGSGEAYQNDVYFGRRGLGGMYDNTDMTISGKLGGIINFETRVSNSLYNNPQDNRVSLNYAGKNLKIDAGDITGSIAGNSLIDFSRSLQGLQVSSDVIKGVRLTGLFSETKAQTRTITIPGGNGPGPYYVYAGQVVDGSERVRVNNRDMVKGEDYTLDPYTGELRFKPGTIINELDTIAVTFETYGYNQSTGVLTGLRADMKLIKGASFGLTFLSQASGQESGGALRTKTDAFYGYENPQAPYVLSYPVEVILIKDDTGKVVGAEPARPMKVTVSGAEKAYGVDYALDPLLPNRVYFRYGVSSSELIRITYTPVNDGETPGDRRVLGADAQFSVGKAGTITAEMASSNLDVSGNGIGGSAWQLRGDLRFLNDRLRWNWNLRDIGANFTAIESPGFRRNERGLTMGLDYQASPGLKLNANVERSRRPSYDYTNLVGGISSGYARPQGQDDFQQLNLGANWQIGRSGQLVLTHNAMETRLFGGGRSAFATDSLTFAYKLKSLNLDLGIGRNHNNSRTFSQASAGGTGDTTDRVATVFGSDSLTARMNLGWRASENLTLAAVLANSAMRNAEGRRSNAQDMQLTASLVPLRNMQLRLGYQVQNSGSLSYYGSAPGTTNGVTRQYAGFPGTGGLTYGSSYGYGGGGYNAGLGGYGNYSGGYHSGGFSNFSSYNFGGKSRGINAALSYAPWSSLSLDLSYNKSSSEGDYLFNSRRNDIALNASYALGERLTLNGLISSQRVTYIGTTGGTNSNMLYLAARAKPLGKLVTNLSFQKMKTSSSAQSSTGGTGQTPDPFTGYPGGNPFYGGGYFSSGGTDLTGYGLRLEYPVWRGHNAFFQLDNAVSTGTWGSDQRTMMLGMDFDLTQNTKLTLGWRNQQHTARGEGTGSSNYSYRVSSLDADINLRF